MFGGNGFGAPKAEGSQSFFGAGFGNSSTNNADNAKSNTPAPFMFGSANNTTTNVNASAVASKPASSNVFGALLTSAQATNQQQSAVAAPPPASPFTFGAATTSNTATPFTFGASNAPNAGFNFGNQPATPRTTQQQQQPTTPFVFSGLSGQANAPGAADSPSLTQVLAGQTTPSTRLIKKPTRRLKK